MVFRTIIFDTMISPKLILLTYICLTFIVSIQGDKKKEARATNIEMKNDEKKQDEHNDGNERRGKHSLQVLHSNQTEKKYEGSAITKYLLTDCHNMITTLAAHKKDTSIHKVPCHTITMPEHYLGHSDEDDDCGCEYHQDRKYYGKGPRWIHFTGEMGNSSIGGNPSHHDAHGHGNGKNNSSNEDNHNPMRQGHGRQNSGEDHNENNKNSKDEGRKSSSNNKPSTGPEGGKHGKKG